MRGRNSSAGDFRRIDTSLVELLYKAFFLNIGDFMPYIRRKPVERTCANCGATFMSNHARRKFCSDTCRVTSHYKKHGYPVYIARNRAYQHEQSVGLPDNFNSFLEQLDGIQEQLTTMNEKIDAQESLSNTLKETILNNLGSAITFFQNYSKDKQKHAEIMNAFSGIMETLISLVNTVNETDKKLDIGNQNDGAFVHALNALHEDVQSAIEPYKQPKIKLRPWP